MGGPLYAWKPSIAMLSLIPKPGTKAHKLKPRISPEITGVAIAINTVVTNAQPHVLNTVTNLERPS